MSLDNTRVPDLDDIYSAQERLRGVVRRTPILESPLLNELTGKRILVKAECLQITGAFKFRGAWSAISLLNHQQIDNGVLAYSSGNHAQAVAYAAARHNATATIVMPNDAPALKIANTKSYGANVVLYDRPGGEDREAIGRALAEQQGSVLIKPYDNTQVIAGQGTCGLEIADQLKELGIDNTEVLVCCGGGGLTSGIALALETELPGATVKPVEPQHYDDVARSLISGRRESIATDQSSICDAIVTPSPGELTFPIIKKLCPAGIVVSDSQVLKAMAMAIQHLKIIAEPGGAVALAAALYKSEEIKSDTILCIVSGGNADPAVLENSLSCNPD